MKQIILCLQLFLGSLVAAAAEVSDYKTNEMYRATLVYAANEYGVKCNIGEEDYQEAVNGYYNDFLFNVTVPCGAPNKRAEFESMSIRFHFLLSENGYLHLTCTEYLFVKARFGHRDPVISCNQY